MAEPAVVPTELSALTEETILYDRHRRDWYVVTNINDSGVGLRQTDSEYSIPHAFFCSLYKKRLVPLEEISSIELPSWVQNHDQLGEEGARTIELTP